MQSKICYFTLALFFINNIIGCTIAGQQHLEISQESQEYDGQYFSLSYPKGWVFQEVYGHLDIQPGQDGFIVFCNNMGRNIDIFSVAFYDPQYPQYNIVVSVKNMIEIFKINQDKGINMFLLQRYYKQRDFDSF